MHYWKAKTWLSLLSPGWHDYYHIYTVGCPALHKCRPNSTLLKILVPFDKIITFAKFQSFPIWFTIGKSTLLFCYFRADCTLKNPKKYWQIFHKFLKYLFPIENQILYAYLYIVCTFRRCLLRHLRLKLPMLNLAFHR